MTDTNDPHRDQQLASARAEIDSIDTQILALIGRRTALANTLAAVKDISESPLRPAREVQLLRRLLQSPPPDVDPDVVLAVWRTLIGSNLRRQRPIEVIVSGGLDPVRQFEAARAHFGPQVKISRDAEVRSALIKAADSRDVIVVAPWPGGAGPGAWWGMLSESRFHGLLVAGGLPMRAQEPEFALVASGLKLEPAGQDRTLMVAFDQRFRLARVLADNGLVGRETARGANHAVLITVDEFMAPNDARRDALATGGLDAARVVGTFSRL